MSEVLATPAPVRDASDRRAAAAAVLLAAARPLNVIQRQLGDGSLGVTSTYLQGIDNAGIINTIHSRRPPMMPASAGLRLSSGP